MTKIQNLRGGYQGLRPNWNVGMMEYWPPARRPEPYGSESRAYGSERILGFGVRVCWNIRIRLSFHPLIILAK
jgi:hypothetical protein